ncbi:MAG: threonine--tRNA ligase [Patescibacteria group bacterium]
MSKQLKIETIRHSLAHIMACAVQNLYGREIKLGIGPVIENGFYYDLDFTNVKCQNSNVKSNPNVKCQIAPNDLPKIEKEMRRLINQNLNFVREKMTIAQAKKLFKCDPYKLDLIEDIEKYGSTELKAKSEKRKATAKNSKLIISIYKVDNFIDLCKGPHIKNTRELRQIGFKLTKLAGAYWRGDEKNKMLTRIYGVAFGSQKELADYLRIQKEAERRDHRKLGTQLDLFSFHQEGAGFPFWHQKGLVIKEELIKFWRLEHQKEGYFEISTPIILNESLWQTSGHMKNYKENMYFTEIDEQKFAIKPMNCPGGLLMYKERPHSYRELPLRVAELGLVHRHEKAGVLHGLMRVRTFTQDDAHIYCTQEQIVDELKGVIKLTRRIYQAFGFDYYLELSTRPKKFIGDIKIWNKAEATLKKVLTELKLPFKINPGDGAFYGPKIDSHIQDSIGRTWQCGTVQLDFAQPENFKLEYINKAGKPRRPVMLHRTIYGSLERFIGILIEHYAGAFPLWLAPVQVMIIPVGNGHIKLAQKMAQALGGSTALRIAIDDSNETVGYKIRSAAEQKIPYTIVIGDKESPSSGQFSPDVKLTVRKFGQKLTATISLREFLEETHHEIEKKT